jgi:hypothetical protein
VTGVTVSIFGHRPEKSHRNKLYLESEVVLTYLTSAVATSDSRYLVTDIISLFVFLRKQRTHRDKGHQDRNLSESLCFTVRHLHHQTPFFHLFFFSPSPLILPPPRNFVRLYQYPYASHNNQGLGAGVDKSCISINPYILLVAEQC